jgi:tRNA(adenine34) deaminase
MSSARQVQDAALDDGRWMTAAIAAATRNPALPFGAVLVDRLAERLVATGWNRGGTDPTAHGEVDVIRCAAAEGAPPDWSRLTLYTTAEPCPMCAGAIIWAGIPRVVYGVSIPWLAARGWFQLDLRSVDVFDRAPGRDVAAVGSVQHEACAALFLAAKAS